MSTAMAGRSRSGSWLATSRRPSAEYLELLTRIAAGVLALNTAVGVRMFP